MVRTDVRRPSASAHGSPRARTWRRSLRQRGAIRAASTQQPDRVAQHDAQRRVSAKDLAPAPWRDHVWQARRQPAWTVAHDRSRACGAAAPARRQQNLFSSTRPTIKTIGSMGWLTGLGGGPTWLAAGAHRQMRKPRNANDNHYYSSTQGADDTRDGSFAGIRRRAGCPQGEHNGLKPFAPVHAIKNLRGAAGPPGLCPRRRLALGLAGGALRPDETRDHEQQRHRLGRFQWSLVGSAISRSEDGRAQQAMISPAGGSNRIS